MAAGPFNFQWCTKKMSKGTLVLGIWEWGSDSPIVVVSVKSNALSIPTGKIQPQQRLRATSTGSEGNRCAMQGQNSTWGSQKCVD